MGCVRSGAEALLARRDSGGAWGFSPHARLLREIGLVEAERWMRAGEAWVGGHKVEEKSGPDGSPDVCTPVWLEMLDQSNGLGIL